MSILLYSIAVVIAFLFLRFGMRYKFTLQNEEILLMAITIAVGWFFWKFIIFMILAVALAFIIIKAATFVIDMITEVRR